MPSIHFVCRDRLNLHRTGSSYESGDWDMPPEEAATLVGGMIYLHQTKGTRSYFGGRVESFREIDTDRAHGRRIIFKFSFTEAGRGTEWRGSSKPRAHSSGIIADDV